MPAPRPASTVILLRPTATRFQVFLVRRHREIAFMGGAHVFPGGRVDDADEGVDLATRHRAAAARELREEAGVVVAADALVPFAHWVTPELEVKRFDTWFFVAVLPAGQEAVHDGAENTDSLWIDPAAAIALAASGTITLPPPTWLSLETLARFDDIGAVLDWARSTPITRIEPEAEERDGIKTLTMPGARFMFDKGRWRPYRDTPRH